MSSRVHLDLSCPNGHNLSVAFSKESFEEALHSGELKFHCNTCDTTWTPTADEITEFRKRFAEKQED